MRNKGGASKSYGEGTFCLFATMICINKSTLDIGPCTFKSTELPCLINEVSDILPLPQIQIHLGVHLFFFFFH